MKFLDAVRQRVSSSDPDTDEGRAAGPLPIDRYDRLDAKAISERLPGLSQQQLGVVEEHERAHKSRDPVLDKLRYLRQTEPIDGYDELDSPGVKNALGSADPRTIRAVRDYERKFAHRPEILAETARLLAGVKAANLAAHI